MAAPVYPQQPPGFVVLSPSPAPFVGAPQLWLGPRGSVLPLGQQGTRCWMTWHHQCLPAKLLTHLPPHTGQGAMTVQFSPEQHLQAGKQLRGQPRTRANAPQAQMKSSPITSTLPRASSRPAHPNGGHSFKAEFAAPREFPCRFSLKVANVRTWMRGPAPRLCCKITPPPLLHPLFQTLKPKEGESCTEKAASSGVCLALLGTEEGSQGGGGQQIPTWPRP